MRDFLWGLGLGIGLICAAVVWSAWGQPVPVDVPMSVVRLDWNAIILAMIAGLPVAITALTGLVMVLRRQQAQHELMNSRLDELVKAKVAASAAEGEKRGVALQKAEEAQRAAGAAEAAPKEGT